MGLRFSSNNGGVQNLPPSVREHFQKIKPPWMYAIALILGFGFEYFWQIKHNLTYFAIDLILFTIFVFWIWLKMKKSMTNAGLNYAEEANKQYEQSLFEGALKDGQLKPFQTGSKIFYTFLLIFCCGFLVFGILSIYETFIKKINSFLPFAILAPILSLAVSYGFLYSNKRILKEARRRNQFIETAEKCWSISKKLWLLMIGIAIIISVVILILNSSPLEGGSIYGNGRLTYAGTNFHPDIINCFESAVPYWIPQNCTVLVYKINANDLRQVLDSKIRNKIFQEQGVNVSEYGLDICLINKNPNIFYNLARLDSIGSQITVNLSASCRVGSFDFPENDLNLIQQQCPNYQNCFGYQKTCCIGIFY